MATIDDKVVSMSFESSKFEEGVNRAIAALEKLKSALQFPSAGKGLDEISDSAKKVDLGFIGRAIEDIKAKFASLRLVGIGVLTHIANVAVDAGARFLKSFTLDPIKQGFQEYSTNLNAVQTILANTAASGAKLKDVNAALNDLNHYSDKTIYNFSEMAKNIGTFTAAGVDLKTSTASIKGIANLAALSGSNAQQASTAMYQLSQAIAAGRVSLQDWNSVVNAGMGGTVFQRALAETAQAMGTLKDGAVKLEGPMKNVKINGESFRESIGGPGPKWLTSDVLTTTLKQFTGDLSDAQLAAEGFNKAQIKAIQATAQSAMHAATEVKTISQVLDVAKETAGSGWAQTWQIIFGNFGEAKTLFTGVSNAVNGFINASSNARNKVLGDWKALGGRTVLIQGIKQLFEDLGAVLKPIKEAFRDIFPATTGKQLFEMTKNFKDLADALKPSASTVDALKRTFSGLFAILDIGKQLVGGIFTVFSQLFKSLAGGTGGFLEFTAKIGDWLTALDKSLKEGNKLHNFFDGLGLIIAQPIKMLVQLGDALRHLFDGFSSGGLSKQMDGLGKSLSPLQRIMDGVRTVWDNFTNSVRNSGNVVQPAVDAIVQALQNLGPAISQALQGMNFEAILETIRTGLFAAIVVMLKNFFGRGSLVQQLTGVGGGLFQNLTRPFKALTGTLTAMQNDIKADALEKIAISIGILTASIVALSLIDANKLQSSMVAIAAGFGELLGAMAIMDKIGKSLGFIKMPFIAGALILLAGAIDILAIAVIALSRLSWEDLAKGLGSVGALLVGIAIAVGPLSANSAGMVRAGIGITAIAVAMNILALAVKQFGGMNMTELGKGLGAVAVGLGVLVGATSAFPKGMVAQGVGLIAIAAGLKILASAVGDFSTMNWRDLGKGLAGLAGSLIAIAGAMNLMPANMLFIGAGLLVVSIAIGKIADAVGQMGGMSVSQIAKGLISLAGALVILAAGLYAMEGAIGGAAALAVAAAGLALLSPALVALGNQSWQSILKGLVELAAALTILGIAGAVLTPVVPALLGLGAALLLLGAGLALAGAGVALIGIGLSAIAVSGTTAIGILIKALEDFVAAIPEIAKNLVIGLLQIVDQLAKTAPAFVDALVKILNSLVDVIIQASPKIAQAFTALIDLAVTVLRDNQGKIIQAGFDLLIALLNGIKNNIGQLVTTVGDIIVRFLSTIASNLGRIVTAGYSILTSLLTGIANGIANVATTVGNIVVMFLNTLANNYARIVAAGFQILTKFLSGIANNLGEVIRSGADIIVKFITGIGDAGDRVVTAATNTMIKFINTIVKDSVKLVNAGALAIVHFLNGVADAIDAHAGEIRSAGVRVGVALIDGMTGGLVSKAQGLYNQISGIMGHAMSLFHSIPGIKSPSTVTYSVGEYIMLGLAYGMEDNANNAYNAAAAVSNGVINTFTSLFQTASPSKVMYEIGKDVNTGFAQGIRGSSDDVKNAFADMNQKLLDTMHTSRQTIAEEQAKLKDLMSKTKPDASAIKEAQDIIKENEDILARSTAGHIALTKSLQDEKKELLGLVDDYNDISTKLKDAKQALADAQKTRADAIKSFSDQYSALPDIVTKDAEGNAIDELATYEEALKHQADAVGAYQMTLDQLRKLGLDDATYQKLLSEGTADQQFATQLLAGGKTAVEGLNVLDKSLQDVSKTLATNAANNLYQAGIDAAQGLIKGLVSQSKDIKNQMTQLANEMVAALKKELKIKSPSEVFAEIGTLSMKGLAQGFTDSTQMVADAVDSAAQTAIDTMRKSMSQISQTVGDQLPDPVITPVLDLTMVRAQAEELATLTNVVPITAAASYRQAATISSEQIATQMDESAVTPVGTSVNFQQNNYSPESLSSIEIYRQTKNQLSQIKAVLGVT